MKKVFTLLLLTLAAFTLKSSAQTTNCSAEFTFSKSALSATFTPVLNTNLPSYHHFWRFGDGTSSSDISPVHAYANGGTYTVTHVFYRSENGVAVCVDSVQKRVEFATVSTVCDLHAGFSFERDPLQPNKVYFHNRSTPTYDIHAVKWSFGDGTYSTDFNASHVYTASGLYKVCLLIQKDNTCQRDTCALVQVQVSTPPAPCDLTATFGWHADSTQINKIHFTNSSTHFEPGDSIRWTFGDGTSSKDINPTHV